MYSPLVKAWNYALDRLSKIKVPGLPDFKEDRQIVFARSDARCIKSESYLQGSYKPDIVLVRWRTLKETQRERKAPYPMTYLSDMCCKSGSDQPKLNWRNVLSTVEVKRGSSVLQGANEEFIETTYTSGFEDLRAEPTAAEPPPPSPPARPGMVREIYITRSRSSVSPSAFFRPLTRFSPDPHVRKKQRVHTLNRWVGDNGKTAPGCVQR